MAISPYSTARPVNFEYKPLGLEVFAKPLAAMQEKYDTALVDAEDLKVSVNSLDADKERRGAIENQIQTTKQNLIDELIRTGNYSQAKRKIQKLNNLYNTDPEKLAMEQQVASHQAFKKAEEERFLKGEISKNTYLTRVNRHLEDYTLKGGLNFKDKNDYNSISTTHSLKDEEENIRKEVNELMKAAPEKVREILGSYKDLDEGYRKEVIDKIVKGKSGPELEREVRAILLGSDKYKAYANERAGDELWNAKKNPEFYETTGKQLLNSQVRSLNTELEEIDKKAAKGDKKAKEYQKSKEYLESRKELSGYQEILSGKKELDKDYVDNMYQNLKIQQVFDTKPYADLYEYQNVNYNRSGYNTPKESMDGYDKNGVWQEPETFEPSTDGALKLNNFSDIKNSSSNISSAFGKTLAQMGNMHHSLIQIGKPRNGSEIGLDPNYDYKKDLNGNMMAANKGKNNWFALSEKSEKRAKEHYYASELKNPKLVYDNAKTLLNAFNKNPKNYNAFVVELRNNGYSLTDNGYKQAFNNLQKEGNYKAYNDQLNELSTASNNYELATNIEKEFNLQLSKDQDYLSKDQVLNNVLKMNLKDPAEAVAYLTSNKFKDPGLAIYAAGLTKVLDLYQKSGQLAGVGNMQQMVNKFVALQKQDLRQEKLNEKSNSLRMIYDVVGNTTTDKSVAQLFSTAEDLSKFKPVLSTSFKGVPGFNDDGSPQASMKILPNSSKASYIPSMGKFMFKVGYSYKDEDGNTKETFTYVEPKKGTDVVSTAKANQIIINNLYSDNEDVRKASSLTLFQQRNPSVNMSETELSTFQPTSNVKVLTVSGKDNTDIVIERNPINGSVGVAKPTYRIVYKKNGKPYHTSEAIPDLNTAKIEAETYLFTKERSTQ